MKVFLSVSLCLLTVDYSFCINKRVIKLPPEAAGTLLMAVQECMPSSNVPVEALLKVYQGGYSEDRNFKEFIYCCYKTAGYLTPDGRMNLEKSIKIFKNEPQVVEGLKRCGEERGSTPKETTFQFFKCFQDTVPVTFSL